MTRTGYLGPPGTFSEAALRASAARVGVSPSDTVPLPTIREVVLAVAGGQVERAIVPLENSLEGSVNEAIDTLVHSAPGVVIVGETVLPVRYALITRPGADVDQVRTVLSHPQALAQCAGFLRDALPNATPKAATSTAEAVRTAVAASEPTVALGTQLAASLYGGQIVKDDLGDDDSNTTRFVWLARAEDAPATGDSPGGKSAVVFSGDGDGTPGWLMRCLDEFARRDVNLSRIESRPAKRRLGHYVFLVEVEGRADAGGPASDAVQALRGHCEDVRVLGAYPAAPPSGG